MSVWDDAEKELKPKSVWDEADKSVWDLAAEESAKESIGISKGQAQEMLGLVEPEEQPKPSISEDIRSLLPKELSEKQKIDVSEAIRSAVETKKRSGLLDVAHTFTGLFPTPEEEVRNETRLIAQPGYEPGTTEFVNPTPTSAVPFFQDPALWLSAGGVTAAKTAGPLSKAALAGIREAVGWATGGLSEAPTLAAKGAGKIVRAAEEAGKAPRLAALRAQPESALKGLTIAEEIPSKSILEAAQPTVAKLGGQAESKITGQEVTGVPGSPRTGVISPVEETGAKSVQEQPLVPPRYAPEIIEAAQRRGVFGKYWGTNKIEIKPGATETEKAHEVMHKIVAQAQVTLPPEKFATTITDNIPQRAWDRAKNTVTDWDKLRYHEKVDEAAAYWIQDMKPGQRPVVLRSITDELTNVKSFQGKPPGYVAVEAIRDITGTAVGAVTGAMVDEENAWRGGVVGGAVGLTLTHGTARFLSKGKYPKGTKFVKGGIEVPPITEPGIPPSVIQKSLEEISPQLAPTKEIVGTVTEGMLSRGVTRDPNMLFSQQVMDEIIRDPKNYREISRKFGFETPAQMIGMGKEKLRESAQFMQVWSEASKKLTKESPEAAKILDNIAKGKIGARDLFQDWYQKVDNIRRGLMVSQVATAMRNLETQGLRVMMEVPEKGMEAVLQKMFRTKDTVKWDDGLQEVFYLFQRNKKFADEVLAKYPKEYSRMFGTFSSDVSTMMGKGWKYANKGVEVLNVLNRGQEFMVRRAVMMGELNAVARNKGLDLSKMMKEGAGLSDILTQKEAHALVDKSLEITFAKNPEYGTMAQKFISAMHFPAGASYIVPFPRFMVNALKFNFEYSPAGFVKLVKPSEWTKMANGDFQAITRASIGSAMFYAALQLRNSEYAGNLPWEIKWGDKNPETGEQKMWDFRPYAPFLVPVIMADIYKRMKEGRGHTITTSMITQGLIGSTFKMRLGATVVDDALQALMGEGDDKKLKQRLHEWFGGNVTGSWAVPLQTVKDLYDGFIDSPFFETTNVPYAEKSESPILQEFTTRIPGYAGETLASPTHAGPVMRESPALRQLTGVSLKTKNVFEQELDRLGYKSSEIFKSTGIREADNLIKKNMGDIAQEVFVPMVKSEEYRALTEEQKDFLISDTLKEARGEALSMLAEQNPKLRAMIKAGKISKREERLQKSQGINIKQEIEEAFKE